MPIGLIVVGVLVLLVALLVFQAKSAGPPQLPETELARGRVIASATAEDPGAGWSLLGSKTEADGLRVKFDHDDDPQAEATFLVDPSITKKRNSLALRHVIRLGSDFQTHHVHTRGHVFRVRVRGTGRVVGKEVKLLMHVADDGTPFGGSVENDDDTDAAVGDWIEFVRVEVLALPRR